jgi:hypothetical protein
MPHVGGGQTRLVVLDEGDDVPAGDVAMVDDGETGRVEVQANRGDLACGNRLADRPSVEEPWEHEIVDVAGLAGNLISALLPEDVLADGAQSWHRAALYDVVRRSSRAGAR